MPRLRRIATGGEGLKGQRFTAELSGCDLFVGPNGAGKSTRLLAVLAARGLAEAPTDTAREYLGPIKPKASLLLTFDNGAELSRDLSLGNATQAAKKATYDADRLLGPHVVRWDLADFARSSDADRAKLLERVCSVAGAGGAWTLARVDTALRKEMGILRDAALPGSHPLAQAIGAWSAGKPIGAWLAEQAKAVDEAFTVANAAAKKAEQEAAAASTRLDEVSVPAGTLISTREALAKVETELKGVSAQLATARQAGKRAGEIEQDRQRAALAVDEAERALAQAEASALTRKASAAAEVERAEKVLAAAQQAAAALPDLAQLQAEVEAAREAHDAANSALALARHRYAKARPARDAAVSALAAADGGIATLRGLAESAAGACRHCGGEDPLGLQSTLTEEQARRVELAAAAEAADKRLTDLHEVALTRAAEERAAAEALRAAGIALAEASRPTAQRAVQSAEETLGRARLSATENATAAERAIEAARTRLTAAQEARAAVDSRTPEAGGGDLDTLEAQHEALTSTRRQLAAEVEALVRHDERARVQQDAIAARAAAAERFAAVKALKAALAALRTEVAAGAYGPIQDAANAFLARAALGMTVEFRDESDFGAVVLQADGSRPYVPYWSLSDAQRAEFAAAMAVALATLTKAPWRGVILDGMERIERPALLRVLRALAGMVAEGALDNFLGALVSSEEAGLVQIEGVTQHWLGSHAVRPVPS